MTKSKKARFALIGVAIAAVLILASCTGPAGLAGPAGPAGPPGPAGPAGAPAVVEPERMPPTVMMVPNMGGARFKADCYGANFEPSETITVCIPITRVEGTVPIETFIGPGGVGGPFEVDELGSFHFSKVRAPQVPGVYPVRVYDEEGEMIASTVIVVEE